MVPKTKNAKTSLFQHFRPDAVFYYTLLMLTTIYFNNYLFFKADKIENVIFIGVLVCEISNLPSACRAKSSIISFQHQSCCVAICAGDCFDKSTCWFGLALKPTPTPALPLRGGSTTVS